VSLSSVVNGVLTILFILNSHQSRLLAICYFIIYDLLFHRCVCKTAMPHTQHGGVAFARRRCYICKTAVLKKQDGGVAAAVQ
jgi:hypothetical protein